MPYTTANPPSCAKNWTEAQKKKCVKTANAVLRGGGSEEDAIFACIRAAGKTKHPGGKKKMFSSIKAAFGIGSKEMSHDEIRNAIYDALPKPAYPGGERSAWVKAVYDNYAIIEDSGKLFKAPYKISKKNELTLGDLKQVEVAYVAIRDKASQIAIGMKSTKSAFEVVTDNQGRDRWISWTSPSFMDREEEITASKALETYAEAAMKIGIHGDLWFGHFPIRIGEPDIHVVIQKHLLESGLFDEDNPDAVAMKNHLKENGPWEVSPTFLHNKEDGRAGVFNWLWVLERSPLPVGTAAHPMAFRLNKIDSEVKSMSGVPKEAYEQLVEVLGEAKVKEYEETGTSLVALMAELGIEGKSMEGDDSPDDGGEGESSDPAGEGEKPVSEGDGQGAVLNKLAEIDGNLKLLAQGVVEMGEEAKSRDSRLMGLEAQVKSLAEEDDDKIGAYVAGLSAQDKARQVAGEGYRVRGKAAEGPVGSKGVGQSPHEAAEEFDVDAEGADGWDVAYSAFKKASGMRPRAKRGGKNG